MEMQGPGHGEGYGPEQQGKDRHGDSYGSLIIVQSHTVIHTHNRRQQIVVISIIHQQLLHVNHHLQY